MGVMPAESLIIGEGPVARTLDPAVTRAIGRTPVGMEALEVSVLPAVVLDGEEIPQAGERRCGGVPQSYQSHQPQPGNPPPRPQQSQQSHSSINSQQSTRCSHGCHTPGR